MKQYSAHGVNNNFDKFLVLTWKNWLLQWRHPIQTTIEILAPVIFSTLLVLIRSLVEPERCDTIVYHPFHVQTGAGIFNSTYTLSRIVWSPCGNEALEQIMQNVVEKYDMKQVCKKNSLDLEKELQTNMIYTLAGVDFGDAAAFRNTINKESRITLRFPAELRMFGEGFVFIVTWCTHLLFPLYQMPGPRDFEENSGANPNYYNEGFLTLQYDISKEIINYHMKEKGVTDSKLPSVMMQRFPYPSWINDPLLQALQSFVGLVVMLSFVYSCINTVKVITVEKEKQLKEAMKIVGIPSWMHWTAWFLKILSFLSISVAVMVVLAKVSWKADTQYSVFSLTNPLVLLVFLLFYVFAIITFCFLISVFFSKANTAATVAGLIWFLSYCPYLFLQDHYNELSLFGKLCAMIGLNTAMAYGFQLVVMFEGSGQGVQWMNIFTTVNPDDNLTMAHVMFMLLFDSILYMVITLYVEALYPGEYGVPKVWYFPLTMVYSRWQKSEIPNRPIEERAVESEIYEKEPTNLKPGIIIRKLTKIYANKKIAVKDLSLTMFEGQITVLLGHNGAGKTTTMSMLTGMIPPTSGTAIINNYDLRTGMDNIRSNLGLCAQHNILFDDLTVQEHLYFFSRLKGMTNKTDLKAEVQKFIELLDLVSKRNTPSRKLSGGMKRKLCFAIAFCGKSKVCLFDEPTAGMDPAARRALWDVIQSQKKDRTILLSTHFMDEADVLGDRIAIMSDGQLQCCGSSFFLKKKYGAGYHLVMEKNSQCEVQNVTDLLEKYIPSITVNSNVGSELTYVLAKEESENFEKMLQDLENNAGALGISNFGISMTTMEEVFMKVGTYQGLDNEKKIQSFGNELRSDRKITIGDRRLQGWDLQKIHFIAMMMKKIIHTKRSWILFLIQNILPVSFLIIAIVVTNTIRLGDQLEKLDFSLIPYDHPITVVSTSHGNNSYYLSYVNMLKTENENVLTWTNSEMIPKMLEETLKLETLVRMKYIIGSSFLSKNNTIIVWFNNQPLHSPPLSLQYAMNAIFSEKMNSTDYKIFVSNHPLPFSPDTKILDIKKGNTIGFQIAFNVGFSMAFVASFYILFCVKDRVIKSKHLQFVSGVSVFMYWITTYLWDLVTFLFSAASLVVTLLCFQEEGFRTISELSRFSTLLFLFGLAMLPEMYLASFLFKVPSTGFTRITLVNIFLGTSAFMTVQVLSFETLDLQHVADVLDWIFLCVPHYALSSGIQDISIKVSMNKLCATINEMVEVQFRNRTGSKLQINFACELQQSCCSADENFFGWDNHGIGRNICFLIGTATVFSIILLASEQKFQHRIKRSGSNIPKIIDESDEPDVLEEKRKVRSGEINPKDYSVVLKDLTKCYNKNIIAVNQLCLGIKGSECFGLLGVNGAGKTTTFKMMTGDVSISKGEAWIYGWNARTDMKNIHKRIGYCPQFDALIYDLTGKETLIMYCLLRGIGMRESKVVAKILAKEFDFYRHLNKRVRYYSGGTKRKLSTAIAIIGDPPIIFLDEPTTGMDPASRRKIWNAFCRLRDSGKCLILTSHSMEECEALCTRLAIMVNGVFRCIGTTQHLKNKYSQGYTLTVKIKRPDNNREISNNDIESVEQFVRTNFPNAVLRERYQELLTFYINDKRMKWSVMFGLMESGKRDLNIDDYSLGQCSLEQVFLSFTKFQRKT